MSQWWESLETGGDDLDDEFDDELEDDPETWDLTSGRAARSPSGETILLLDLPKQELLTLIIDGVLPDGTDATDEMRAYALDGVLREKDKPLWGDVLLAYNGTDRDNGVTTDPEARMRAQARVDTARLKSIETWKAPSGELAFNTGMHGAIRRDERGRSERAVRTTPTKLRSADVAGRILIDECRRSGVLLDDLLRPTKPGRPTKEAQLQRARLSIVVAAARQKGVTLEAIGQAIGMSKQRVHELETVGRALQQKLSG